jgi:hypothetical protein
MKIFKFLLEAFFVIVFVLPLYAVMSAFYFFKSDSELAKESYEERI